MTTTAPHARPPFAWANSALLLLLSMAVLSLWRAALAEDSFGLTLSPDGGMVVRDFAAHQAVARALWSNPVGGPGLDPQRRGYDVTSHRAIFTEWAGRPVDYAMPFPYSPTILWLFLPLRWLPMAWSFVAWTCLAYAAVVWQTSRPGAPPLGALVYLTPLGVTCFALGQSAPLTAAGLVFLATLPERTATKSVLAAAAVLWVLTAKPPLALAAGAALIATRQWRVVAIAVTATLVTTLALVPWLGLRWISDYVHLLANYNRDDADPLFVWSLVPKDMTNLRALLHVDFGASDRCASRLSFAAWFGSLALTLTVGWATRNRLAAWGAAVLGYLLFCPHVTSTEDVQTFVVASLWFATLPADRPAVRRLAASAAPLLCLCAPAVGPLAGFRYLPILFVGKLALFIYFCSLPVLQEPATPSE